METHCKNQFFSVKQSLCKNASENLKNSKIRTNTSSACFDVAGFTLQRIRFAFLPK